MQLGRRVVSVSERWGVGLNTDADRQGPGRAWEKDAGGTALGDV